MNSNVVVSIAVAALVVGRFLLRELRERKLVLSRIFLPPAVLGALAVVLSALTWTKIEPFALPFAIGTACALVAGGGIGFAVARFTTVRLGEAPDVAYVLGSPATVAIWIAALALRLLARLGIAAHEPGAQLAANVALLVLLAAALAILRYRMLIDVRALRVRGVTAPVPVL